MSARRTPPRPATSGRGRAARTEQAGRARWIVLLVVVAAMVGIIAWQFLRPRAQTATSFGGLPDPIGGPEVAQDVNTLLGKPAPSFSLPDSEGKRYTVKPGQGQPVVLISHMGIT
jgi:hypothetical protein